MQKTKPPEPITEPTAPNGPGPSYLADVVRREKQFVLVLVDAFSLFVAAAIVPLETSPVLADGIINLTSATRLSEKIHVRTNAAPAFKSLVKSKLLETAGIKLELPRLSFNKNSNAVADKVISQLHNQIKETATG